MTQVEIGDTLKSFRDGAEMTQKELAELADVHRTYVSLLERDQKSPTLEVLFRLCQALGVRPSDFLAEVEESLEDNNVWWNA